MRYGLPVTSCQIINNDNYVTISNLCLEIAEAVSKRFERFNENLVDVAAGAFRQCAHIYIIMAPDNWTRSIFRLCLSGRSNDLTSLGGGRGRSLRFNSFALTRSRRRRSRLKSKFALVNGHKPHH